MGFEIFENLFEFLVVVAYEEQRGGPVQVWDAGVDPDPVLNLDFAEVVDLLHSFLDCGRMAHSDQPLLDVDDLELSVK